MLQSPIELKGSTFTLSVIYLYSAEPTVIRKALLEKVKQAPQFLKNAPIVINVSSLEDDMNWGALPHTLEEAGLHLAGICGCRSERQRDAITRAGLPLLNEGKTHEIEQKKIAQKKVLEHNPTGKARIISTHVRSGQQIYARNGDLIVASSVSAGAELIADGNIHIYGIMRGRAVAGASGDTECHIFCIYFAAELVSIAGQYWLNEHIPPDYLKQSIQLSLLNNVLVIQHLH